MKYQSELINEILEDSGHEKSTLHYESECIESWVEENKGAYPKLCDYQSEWLNYINENIGIGDFPYVTLTDVTDATINNSVPFAYKSAILKGNTIINLVNNFTFGTGAEETDNYFTLTQTNTTENIGVNIETSLIELNRDYTLIYFIQEKTTTVSTSLVVKQASYLAPSGNVTLTQNIGWNKIKFNLSSFGSTRGLNIAIASSEQDGNYIKFAKNKFALLAGDWTNKNIPFNTVKYGMQSVKMPVLKTTGKNLFDGKLENGAIISSTGSNTPSTNNVRSVGYIKVNPNASLVLSNDLNYSNNIIYEYDSNKDFIGRKETNPFTTSTNCQYIRFRSNSNQPNLDVKYQIEYGTQPTTYEPYKSNILNVNEPVELHGIGDVKDELNLLTGEISNNFNKITIDGTEKWYKSSNETELTVRYRCDNIGVSILKENICICDSYNVGGNTVSDDLVVAFSDTMLTYRVLKSKFPTLEDFKKWLNDNPHTFIYQTEKSIKTVDLLVQDQNGNIINKIKPIEGTIHLSTSSDTIKPLFSGEIPVEATTQNLASFIDLEMEE